VRLDGGRGRLAPRSARRAGRGAAGALVPAQAVAGRAARVVRVRAPAAADVEIHSLHVQGGVWMLVGGFVNAAIQVGDDGVLVVDTMTEPLADKMIAEIKRIAGDKPIRYVVNTHVHADTPAATRRSPVPGSRSSAATRPDSSGRMRPTRRRSSRTRSSRCGWSRRRARRPCVCRAAHRHVLPRRARKSISTARRLQLFYRPKAHTDGDVLVFFRKSDVVVTGDLYVTTTFPVIDLERGGSLNGIVDSLNVILDLNGAARQAGGGHLRDPRARAARGRSRRGGHYRDMVTIIRDQHPGTRSRKG
jgi:glyoxylase-like metal-dependent hydrolase (beta-lactamase superfamily II)